MTMAKANQLYPPPTTGAPAPAAAYALAIQIPPFNVDGPISRLFRLCDGTKETGAKDNDEEDINDHGEGEPSAAPHDSIGIGGICTCICIIHGSSPPIDNIGNPQGHPNT